MFGVRRSRVFYILNPIFNIREKLNEVKERTSPERKKMYICTSKFDTCTEKKKKKRREKNCHGTISSSSKYFKNPKNTTRHNFTNGVISYANMH